MMTATFAFTCDACETPISVTAQKVDTGLDIPDRQTVLGMDLCEPCKLKAQMAVRAALGLHQLGSRRVLN